MSSRSRSAHRAAVPLRSRAFAAAARYRADYGPDHDASTVAAGVAASDPALALTPGLVAAAAALPPLDPADAVTRQIARLGSVLTRDEPPRAMDAWRLAAVVTRLADEVDDGGSHGHGLIVTTTRAAYWWGCAQPTASVALRRLVDGGSLVVTGRAGRSRRMRLGIGNPSFGRVDEWLNPTHPCWSATDPALAYAPDATERGHRVRRWLAVVRGEAEGSPVEPDPGAAERQAEGRARYEEHAEQSRQMIVGWQGDRAADRVVRQVMRGLPPAGSDPAVLQAWMRLAIQRAAAGETEVDSARVAAVAQEAGHSESVARQLGERLSDAAGTAQGWGTF